MQGVRTCNAIVPIMKSTPVPEGEFNCVFFNRDRVEPRIYENDILSGLNHGFDEAAWG